MALCIYVARTPKSQSSRHCRAGIVTSHSRFASPREVRSCKIPGLTVFARYKARPSADPHADASTSGFISALLPCPALLCSALLLLAAGPCGVLFLDITRTVSSGKLRQRRRAVISTGSGANPPAGLLCEHNLTNLPQPSAGALIRAINELQALLPRLFFFVSFFFCCFEADKCQIDTAALLLIPPTGKRRHGATHASVQSRSSRGFDQRPSQTLSATTSSQPQPLQQAQSRCSCSTEANATGLPRATDFSC